MEYHRPRPKTLAEAIAAGYEARARAEEEARQSGEITIRDAEIAVMLIADVLLVAIIIGCAWIIVDLCW